MSFLDGFTGFVSNIANFVKVLVEKLIFWKNWDGGSKILLFIIAIVIFGFIWYLKMQSDNYNNKIKFKKRRRY